MKFLGFELRRTGTSSGPTAKREPSSEIGYRQTPENRMDQLFRQMWVDPELRAVILDIREFDRLDPRVKRIHSKMARSSTKGGLACTLPTTNKKIHKAWSNFERKLGLNNPQKLQSDCRGLLMEGNLPLQWVLDNQRRVRSAVRMPTDTLIPRTDINGQFKDMSACWEQHDFIQGLVIAKFAFWQLTVARLDPDNFDDQGCLGRPWLDASRTIWKKLTMTEEDLVIHRRERAPMRLSHVLEGAGEPELEAYQEKVEQDKSDVKTDFYSSKRGGVTGIQGAANLADIDDITHLLDTFFTSAPGGKALFGYINDLSRDILEDLKKEYFEEIDSLQDTLASAYEFGFRLDLLLQGIDPNGEEAMIGFKERRTETPNQAADRALKFQALAASEETVLRTAGLDPEKEREQRKAEAKSRDPYPDPNNIARVKNPTVSVTPGNAPKGESATTISTRGTT